MWHPEFEQGKDYAEQIHANYGREIQGDTIYRRPGIPVFYKNEINNEIDLDQSSHTVVFVLVDDEMVIDSNWGDFLNNLLEQAESKPDYSHRIYPISLSETAFQIENINKINFISLHEIPEEKKIKKLLGEATHEMSRLLLNQPRGVEVEGTRLSTSPVSLFLSHAKKDGAELAKSIKGYIHEQTPLKTFFDANDIAAGHSFSNEISESIEKKETALLIIHTDTYSSRDWCRREVIEAKLSSIPIVVVNTVTVGEARSFPYMGNVPTIRWDGSVEMIQDIIDNTLMEILRDLYIKKHLESLINNYNVSDRVHKISHHPELMSFVNILEDEKHKDTLTVLYPDPPLGYEELQLLQSIKPKYKFLTPTMLPILRYAEQENSEEPLDILHGIKIGLSISNPDDSELLDHGISKTHVRDGFVEFARYLLVHGGKLFYGGDLRKDGFTEQLADLVRNYFPEETQPFHKIYNYQAWPMYLQLTKTEEAALKKVVEIKKVDSPQVIDLEKDTFLPPNSKENRVIWAKSLTKMREEMNQDIEVRILMGGSLQGYKGKYPGLLEEAYLAMRDEKPLFLLGGFGGCTEALINAIQGKKPIELSRDFQMKDKEYSEMVKEYNTDSANDHSIDYNALLEFFEQKGIESLNNGLSEEENLILFKTPYVPEMVSLVLKGLASIENR